MGRKREFDTGEMLTIIREQFWSRGYEGTSTYDLMEVTGLGKGSIYKAYGNKHDLYLRTFTDYCQDTVGAARKALSTPARSSAKRIEIYLLDLANTFTRQLPRIGCYLTKATVDLAANDDAVAAIAKRAYEDIGAAFEATIREGQAAGEVDAQADA